ncbi:hypothetical protein V6N13_097620 [Hibiscus sabdariffa]
MCLFQRSNGSNRGTNCRGGICTQAGRDKLGEARATPISVKAKKAAAPKKPRVAPSHTPNEEMIKVAIIIGSSAMA